MENELNLTPEMLEQAAKAPSAAALLALAKEKGITLTAEEAAEYYAQLHPKVGALSDEELDNVSGGMCEDKPDRCDVCGMNDFVYITEHLTWYCRNCIRKQ